MCYRALTGKLSIINRLLIFVQFDLFISYVGVFAVKLGQPERRSLEGVVDGRNSSLIHIPYLRLFLEVQPITRYKEVVEVVTKLNALNITAKPNLLFKLHY